MPTFLWLQSLWMSMIIPPRVPSSMPDVTCIVYGKLSWRRAIVVFVISLSRSFVRMSWRAHFKIVSLVVLPVSVSTITSGFLSSASCTVLCHLWGVDILPRAFSVVMQKELSLCCSGCLCWVWSAVAGCDGGAFIGGVGGVWVVGGAGVPGTVGDKEGYMW